MHYRNLQRKRCEVKGEIPQGWKKCEGLRACTVVRQNFGTSEERKDIMSAVELIF